MKRIVSVSLGPSRSDYEFTTTFLGHDFHVRRAGTDWSVEKAEALLRQAQGEADAVGIGMVQEQTA